MGEEEWFAVGAQRASEIDDDIESAEKTMKELIALSDARLFTINTTFPDLSQPAKQLLKTSQPCQIQYEFPQLDDERAFVSTYAGSFDTTGFTGDLKTRRDAARKSFETAVAKKLQSL
ncbi:MULTISPECIES: hypothetical protein [Bifidobacterium]|uniref:Uncharacterized protein n=1 Tax=Bifidobacterium tibiigranuli TaxID=2172043 RepID=A0A5N6S768_9BIFI|nr:hypothetical protein [Bifidobacterium tibiigranuli]KAE8130226.1 hypothetical protein DDE84_01210 [Bifidobacterium tibiigranuli]KAE8130415.1 hypothetical protein DDF78_00445 [Bifidobacterium tibiigranuli]